MMSPGCTSNRSQMRRMVSVVTDSPLESLAMVVDESPISVFEIGLFIPHPRKHIEKLEKPNGSHHCSSSLLTDYQQTAASKSRGLKALFPFHQLWIRISEYTDLFH